MIVRSVSFSVLQWGHDLAVMESCWATETGGSIRWLQWGHDLAVMESGASSCVPSTRGLPLQWGHDLAVMERARADLRGHPRWRFNGAMTLRSWRGPKPNVMTNSMQRRFNGAMTLRSWREVGRRLDRTREAGFNGAMTLRSWRAENATDPLGLGNKLQWGHDLAVMESG